MNVGDDIFLLNVFDCTDVLVVEEVGPALNVRIPVVQSSATFAWLHHCDGTLSA